MMGRCNIGVLLLAMLLIFSAMGAFASGAEWKNTATRGYTSHSVIRINGDSEFTAANGVVSGSGTASDPYVISGWIIDAGTNGAGIFIGNTTAYFVVQNNYVYNSTRISLPYQAGASIIVYNATHGMVRYNEVYASDYGIFIYQNSRYIDVEYNNVTGSTYFGVWISFSNNINVTFNNASDNRGSTSTAGIDVYGSYNVSVEYNTCINNTYGIYMGGPSHDNTLKFNNCSFNGNYGIYMSGSSTSVANNNTLIYGNDIYGNQYGIRLAYSENVSIRRNIVSGNLYEGIYLYSGSSYNTIWENTVLHNDRNGVYLYAYSTTTPSDHNIVMWNNISENAGAGLYVYTSSYNSIHNNMFYNNTGYGVELISGANYNVIYENSFYFNHGSNDTYNSSNVQAYDAGTGNQWNISYEGNYWHDWTTPDANGDGIVDNPYAIDGTANSEDKLPLVHRTAVPELSPAIVLIAILAGMLVLWRRNH
ncbi:MAG: hypothetical protein GXO25_02475 [Euryarchaeota archaeon]|nr:hypothetical protein [Euryarchaeota archaeon]